MGDYEERELLAVPDMIKQFVVYFYRHIREKNVYEILTMYDFTWNKLSEQFYKAAPWPTAEVISPLADDDHVFLLLYRELYFRHLYAKTTPTLEQQAASWANYCALFALILHGSVNMQLPTKWLWDMVDEFIYQYQFFCQYRGKLSIKTAEEIATLRQYDAVWHSLAVCSYLQALVKTSGIDDVLEREAAGKERFSDTEGYEAERSNVLKLLGYFAKVGLLRVHTLLGDYATAKQVLVGIDLRQPNGMFTKVVGAYITLFSNLGFCDLMLRQYPSAIRSFNAILLYLLRTRAFQQRAPAFELVTKRTEQLYAMLAMALSLCPQSKLVDEAVLAATREKYTEKMSRMQRGDESAYDELFSYACPKFVSPARPDYDAAAEVDNANQEAYRTQLRLFLSEVRQQAMLPTLRSFLKLYTTIPLAKLASLMEVEPASLQQQLLCLKHKQRGGAWGGTLEGSANVELDFFLDGDMIHVLDTKVVRQHADFFTRHVVKFDAIAFDLAQARV